jgi:hypothetical protein
MNLARGSREPQLRLRLFSFGAYGVAVGLLLACGAAASPRVAEADAAKTSEPTPSDETEAPAPTPPTPSSSSAALGGTGGGGVGWGRIGLANARPTHQSDVEASLHRQRAAWAPCRSGSGVVDAMTVRITVDAQGTITNATSIAPGTASPAEMKCVLGALRRLTVPPPNRPPHAVEVILQFAPLLRAPDSSAPPRPGGPLADAPASTDYADHITGTIRQARGAFRLCHERYLRCCPNLSDRVGLSFTIEEDGSVTHATSTVDTSVPDGEAGCVLEAVRSLSFPPPPNGRLVVRYPLHFSSMRP